MGSFDLEDATTSLTWQQFESVVSEILKDNGFMVSRNFRFKTDRRYEIDIVAAKDGMVLCIDCKQWRGGRSKRHGILKAVEKQEVRARELSIFLQDSPSARKQLGIAGGKIIPHTIIATLLQEEIVKESDTFVVPVWKMNSFLLEIEKYF